MKKLIPLTLLVLMSCGKSTDKIDVATPVVKAITKTTSSSIINGTLIKDEDLASKSTVALVGMFSSPFCSGTLVSENLVLTAAHCVSRWTEKSFFKSSKRVTVLSNIGFKLNSSEDVTKLEMEAVELYPIKKEKEQFYHDIALVKFKGVLPKEFKPVAILAPEYKLVGNKDLILAGFGLTSSDESDTPTSYQIRIPYKGSDGDILILNQLNGKEGAYHGDSGGPAYLESKDELLLAGSTIGGLDGESEVYYSKVSAYKQFILDSAKKLNGTLPVFKNPEE
ncbi:trypsin-like serine protease [Bacteriovorax sp. PP10]|uniref:Trypsin-like serine protease n=1 Tax=Bacteriovorax antarcticus TaxID=3088717 RepID=A0ABU5VXX5_9BACT|nr:trypsin-like serine protease [Bacteriovorax sp. PP10]MEA9356855.1 trypsin-like serine protease [Bacteriovorax sp. PP10]